MFGKIMKNCMIILLFLGRKYLRINVKNEKGITCLIQDKFN